MTKFMIYIMLVVAFFKGESVCKNPTIKFAIETEFKGVKQFSEGLAAVQIGTDSEGWEEWVYIDGASELFMGSPNMLCLGSHNL